LPNKTLHFKCALLVTLSVFLTAFTIVLGAAPLRVLRQKLSRKAFFILGLSVGFVFIILKAYLLASLFIIFILMIGVYKEMELHGHSVLGSGFYSLIISLLTVASGFCLWAFSAGPVWKEKIIEQIEIFLSALQGMSSQTILSISAEELMLQLPSGVTILLILSLFLSLVLEKRIMFWMPKKVKSTENLRDFRLPEYCIWFLLVSILGAFYKSEANVLQPLAANVLNVFIVVYFFQGLAVVAHFFDTFKVSFLWRVLWMTILVLQMFLLLSLIGVLDLWVNFRAWFLKKATPMKNI